MKMAVQVGTVGDRSVGATIQYCKDMELDRIVVGFDAVEGFKETGTIDLGKTKDIKAQIEDAGMSFSVMVDWANREMVLGQDTATVKFMTAKALAKWNSQIRPHFGTDPVLIPHFFAHAMMVPRLKGEAVHMLYFNPWVDGVLLTGWKQVGATWQLDEFYLAPGERARGQLNAASVITNSDLPPIWLWGKGTLMDHLAVYYADMGARLSRQNIDDFLAWLSLPPAEVNADLLRLKLRMGVRARVAAQYMTHKVSQPALSAAIMKLKYDAVSGNSGAMAAYSRHAKLLADFRPEIIKSMKLNWIFVKQDAYSLITSSIVAPRYFILMNVARSGEIKGALMGDLEAMADKVRRQSAQPKG